MSKELLVIRMQVKHRQKLDRLIYRTYAKEVQAISDTFQAELATGWCDDDWQVHHPSLGFMTEKKWAENVAGRLHPAFAKLRKLDAVVCGITGPSNAESYKPRRSR